MKYSLTLLALFLLSFGSLSAQQTVGFSDSANLQQLIDYRLPDWGYSNFMLDFSSGGRFLNSLNKNFGADLKRERRRINFLVAPAYELYRESEKRIFELNSNISFNYETRKDKSSPDNQKIEDRSWESSLRVDVALREYLASDIFLLGGEDIELGYNSSSREERIDASLTEDEERLERIFASDTRLGIGIGRVRNVGPVIRALRLKERYGALANGNQLDDEEIAAAADIFTKYDGYRQRYDRPEKYFWQAMDEAANGSFSNLQPFDLLYLTDVLDENIGRRLEGWELAGGGIFNYSNSLNRLDVPLQTPSFERSLTITKNAGAFIEGRWYKNLSLNHQLGVTADASRTYPLGSNELTQWNTAVKVEASWLWNVTDRFLMNTRLFNRYNTYKREADEFLDERRYWYNSSQLSSSLTYFIENRLAFNIGLRYILHYDGGNSSQEVFDQRQRQLSFTAGVQYYFSRNLF